MMRLYWWQFVLYLLAALWGGWSVCAWFSGSKIRDLEASVQRLKRGDAWLMIREG